MNFKKRELWIILSVLCACTNTDGMENSARSPSKMAERIFSALDCSREAATAIAAKAVEARAPDEYRKLKKTGFNVYEKTAFYIGDEITEIVILESRYLSRKVEKTIFNGTVYYEEGVRVNLRKDCSVDDVRPYKGNVSRYD